MHLFRKALHLAVTGVFWATSPVSKADPLTVIQVTPASLSTSVGSVISLNVNISNVADLYDFQVDVSFDPRFLQATSVSEGSFLSSAGPTLFVPGTIDNTAGIISFNGDTLLGASSGATGTGDLIMFDLRAIAAGTSGIDLSNIILQDSTGAVIAKQTIGGSVTSSGTTPTSVTPEPSTLTLLGTGLMCLLYIAQTRARRRRSA